MRPSPWRSARHARRPGVPPSIRAAIATGELAARREGDRARAGRAAADQPDPGPRGDPPARAGRAHRADRAAHGHGRRHRRRRHPRPGRGGGRRCAAWSPGSPPGTPRAEQLDELDAMLDEADDLLILLKQRHQAGAAHRPACSPAARHHAAVQRHRRSAAPTTRCWSGCSSRAGCSPGRSAGRGSSSGVEDDDFGLARWTSHRALVRALRDRDAASAEEIMISDASGGLHDLLGEAPAPPS